MTGLSHLTSTSTPVPEPTSSTTSSSTTTTTSTSLDHIPLTHNLTSETSLSSSHPTSPSVPMGERKPVRSNSVLAKYPHFIKSNSTPPQQQHHHHHQHHHINHHPHSSSPTTTSSSSPSLSPSPSPSPSSTSSSSDHLKGVTFAALFNEHNNHHLSSFKKYLVADRKSRTHLGFYIDIVSWQHSVVHHQQASSTSPSSSSSSSSSSTSSSSDAIKLCNKYLQNKLLEDVPDDLCNDVMDSISTATTTTTEDELSSTFPTTVFDRIVDFIRPGLERKFVMYVEEKFKKS
eukprot:TRINITY_DN2779_c1_g1_i2.p1 TRINITY_DN2779_c1_g1~~TRINITY_DN2779_c1_g1_i2.p1  ORF type:complete len:288 (+),score=122.84 TRINITY_DN2779_c1_g1_i2:186-1049(+)